MSEQLQQGADPAPTPKSDPEPSATPIQDGVVTDPRAPVAAAAPAGGASDPAVGTTKGPKQTLAGRVWVALVCAAVLLVLMIIFIAENSRRVTISFLGAHGHISLALALLIAVVVGIAVTLLVGTARIIQLRLEVRRRAR